MMRLLPVIVLAISGLSADDPSGLRSEVPYYEALTVCVPQSAFDFAGGATLAELPDGRLVCIWCAKSDNEDGSAVLVASTLLRGATKWSDPRSIVATPNRAHTKPVLVPARDNVLRLFYQTGELSESDTASAGTITMTRSRDGGFTWSPGKTLPERKGSISGSKAVTRADGSCLLPFYVPQDGTSRVLIVNEAAAATRISEPISPPGAYDIHTIAEVEHGGLLCYLTDASGSDRLFASSSVDGGHTWKEPSPTRIPNSGTHVELLRLDSGALVLAHNPESDMPGRLNLWGSRDAGKNWSVFRRVSSSDEKLVPCALIQSRDGLIHLLASGGDSGLKHIAVNEAWVWEHGLLHGFPELDNVVPPYTPPEPAEGLPVVVPPFYEHIRGEVTGAPEEGITEIKVDEADGRLMVKTDPPTLLDDGTQINDLVETDGLIWYGTDSGLYAIASEDDVGIRQKAYGVGGPLASQINALAIDSKGALWVGTPLGLSILDQNKTWTHLRGDDGLPVENVTAIEIDKDDRVWIGTSRGAVLYVPDAEHRKWFYRAGKRYLPGNHVRKIAVAPLGMPAYFLTNNGIGRLDAVKMTLEKRARIIENRLNQRHRRPVPYNENDEVRAALVGACVFNNADDLTDYRIPTNDNDGLWTAYHVAAMSLCYGTTGSKDARESARRSMYALYTLQNASGIPGLVARSVVPAEQAGELDAQWRPTSGGDMYWKSDTSSDEIDGHYMAFYTYYEHIAKYDREESETLKSQVRKLTDYIADNGYQLIDWDGERTRWGFWNPGALNGNPVHYLENGLNSLEILSFLKVAYYITGDPKYHLHYQKLILDHDYLDNVLLEKKVFPDENNHSDNQLAFVAWYPLLQLERDPLVRKGLLQAVRRHYEIVKPERSSFFTFVFATADPAQADITGAVANLCRIPTDRRLYPTLNSERADIQWARRPNRFGHRVLTRVLPADERNFDKWNRDPYRPDHDGNALREDDGAAYLLPYWMGRYHGFIVEEPDGEPAAENAEYTLP